MYVLHVHVHTFTSFLSIVELWYTVCLCLGRLVVDMVGPKETLEDGWRDLSSVLNYMWHVMNDYYIHVDHIICTCTYRWSVVWLLCTACQLHLPITSTITIKHNPYTRTCNTCIWIQFNIPKWHCTARLTNITLEKLKKKWIGISKKKYQSN